MNHHAFKMPYIGLTTTILVLVMASSLIQIASAATQEILTNFKPIAMDESVRFLADPFDQEIISRKSDKAAPKYNEFDQILLERELKAAKPPARGSSKRIGETEDSKSPLVDILDSSGRNISETLFRLPANNTPELTRMITGPETPMFVHEGIIKPTMERTSTNPNSKVLASYKILIPVLIPAVSKSETAIRQSFNTKPIKYVQETHTKMVPMEKTRPSLKTILKAERVPQKIITDFVRTDGMPVPSNIDDKLKSNEKLIKTVVTNYA